MNTPTQTGSSQKQVFISYSHEPPENAHFVRWLAGNLRIAGFVPWLDEEQLWGGDLDVAITTAARQSDFGLFVISKRWLERPYTLHEVRLFKDRPPEKRVILQREQIDETEVGPFLSGLKRIDWPTEDSNRDARFWQIYCAIEGIPPGPRETWPQKGAEALRKAKTTTEPPLDAKTRCVQRAKIAKPKPDQTRITLPCKGQPISCLVGTDWSFLVSDAQEWVGIRPDGELHDPFAGLAEHAAAIVDAAGRLLVGLYSSQVAWLGENDWEYLTQEAPVLSLCACPDANLVGTASGSVVPLERDGKSSPLLHMRDPVIALAYFECGVVALGSRGVFGRIAWPPDKEHDSFTWIETGAMGRPAGFFTAIEQDHIGIYSPTRIGILQPATGRLTLCSHVFDEGIREVVFFGAQRWSYGVLTDAGNLVLVDNAMVQSLPVRFPGSPLIRGCAPGGWRGITTAWGADGSVYRLTFDGAPTRIAEGDAVLAYSPPAEDRTVHVVRWTKSDGASVEIGKH
jgi:hypothetical protein